MQPAEAYQNEQRSAKRGFVPALGLFLAAPLIGEFLLGNLPITSLWILPIIAPLYGCGALLIREIARRYQLGWASMILMCLAYGIAEEAFVTQSLFNPNYLGLRLLDYGFIPQVGISAWWTTFVLAIHTIWSMAVPIALIESLTPATRTTPWLGKLGLGIVATVFVVVCTGFFLVERMTFRAPIMQDLASVLIIIVLVTSAVVVGRSNNHAPARASTTFNPRVMGGVALLFGSAFMILAAIVQAALPAILTVSGMIVLLITGSALLWQWSTRPGWHEQHTFAVAAGLLLVYAWFGFVQVPSVATSPVVDRLGNGIFAGAALVFLLIARKRVARSPGAAASESAEERPMLVDKARSI